MDADDFISHYGKKGMKWGQRKERKAWLKEAKSGETATKVYQDAVKSFGPTLKKLNKNPAFADIATNKNTRREYDAVMSKIFNQHLSDASIRTYNPNLKRAVIYQMTPDGSMLRAIESKLVEHATMEKLPLFNLVRDEKGFIIDISLVESSLGQSEMSAEDFISHYGTKGMRWGVRKSGRSKVGASKDAKRAGTTLKKAKKNSVKSLTNKEIKDLTARIELERKYSSLNPSKVKKGHDAVKTVLAVGATVNTAVAFSNSPAGRALRMKFSP